MTTNIAVLIAVLALFYPFMSVFEWTIHRYLMHRKSFPAFMYRWFPTLNYTLEAHRHFHHGQCFREDFHHDDKLPCNLFNLTLDLQWIPMILVCGLMWLVSPAGSIAFFVLVYVHHALWGYIHSEMHIPGSHWWVPYLPFWKALHDHHELHHVQPGTNYNIIFLGCDWLFGTRAKVN